ncbi:Lon protease [mine drainage metagenome]|uniref:Lon protease n=1 Tax=mine drainage metagenome TaxID=410659 RepID=A0A1J5P6Z2_9ZZZZ
MFVATANTLNIPAPLMDRMEIIRLSGYTEDEKVSIAERYLVPKQMAANGLKPEECAISESALRDIVRYYTREAGVRSLERELGNLARKTARITHEIEELTHSLRDQSSDVGADMARSVHRAQRVGALVTNTGNTLGQVGAMLTEVRAVTGEQTGLMRQLTSDADRQRQDAGQAAELLQVLVQRFAATMTLIRDAREQLETGVTAVSKSSDAAVTLRVSLAMHYQWIGALLAAAQKQERVDMDVSNFHGCFFGKWYFGAGAQHFGSDAGFAGVDSVHQDVHRTGQSLVEAIRAGDAARTAELASRLEGLSDTITDRLEALMRQIP